MKKPNHQTTPAADVPYPRWSAANFLKAIAAASAGFALPGYLAEALTIAPSVTQGPYYPTVATMAARKRQRPALPQ